MLSRFVLRSYPTLIEACLWILPIIAFFFFGLTSRFSFNIWFAFFGFIGTFIVCALLSGGLLVLMDIRESLKK